MGVTVNEGARLRWTPIVAGMGVVVAGVLPGFLTASLAPRIEKSFAFSEARLGLAIALFYVVCVVGSWLAGGWVRALGVRRALVVGTATSAASCLAIALLARSSVVLTALMLVGGIGNALAGPSVAALLREVVPSGRHGFALGAQQSGAPVGTLLAGLALPLVAIPFGWRWAYVLAAGVAVACGAAASRSAPTHRAGAPGPDVADGHVRAGAAHGDARARRTLESPGPSAGVAVKPEVHRTVMWLAAAAACGSVAAVGLISFLTTYAVHVGMSEREAGLALGAASLLAIASRVGFGALGDRPGRSPFLLAAAMFGAAALGMLVFLGGTPLAVVAGALIALGVGWGWAGPMTLAAVQAAPASPASAVGVMMAGLFSGSVVGPLALGQLGDRGHYTAAWLLCASGAAAAAGAALLAGRSAARPPGGA